MLFTNILKSYEKNLDRMGGEFESRAGLSAVVVRRIVDLGLTSVDVDVVG